MEMDEELVILGLCRLVLVVDLDELTLRMSSARRSVQEICWTRFWRAPSIMSLTRIW